MGEDAERTVAVCCESSVASKNVSSLVPQVRLVPGARGSRPGFGREPGRTSTCSSGSACANFLPCSHRTLENYKSASKVQTRHQSSAEVPLGFPFHKTHKDELTPKS